MKTIRPRMKNPAMIIPDAMQPIQALYAATQKGDVPPKTLALVHLRASQINGCSLDPFNHYDQCLQSPQCHDQTSGRRNTMEQPLTNRLAL